MGLTPLALSVHNFISSVGADAGFAAIIGLAVLVLLYFAHARETANLREQAALLTQRLQQAEARVAQLTRAQPVAVPAPLIQASRGTAGAGAPAGAAAAIPAAPAGVAAPALAAATRVVPLAIPAAPEAVPSPEPVPAGEPFVEPRPVLEPAFAARAAAAPVAAALQPQLAPAGPSPATVAGANGARREGARAVADLPPAPPAAGDGAAAVAPLGGRDQIPRPPLPPIGAPPQRRPSFWRRFGPMLGLVAFVGVIAVLLIVTSVGGSNPSAQRTGTTNAPGAHRRQPAFNPSSVTVAVLNGTSTNQLAHAVAAKLMGFGYKEGTITDASNQTETTTVVAYLPGAANRTAALHVATALKLGASSVQPIDQGTDQVACPPPGACTANVVVTVGANLATL